MIASTPILVLLGLQILVLVLVAIRMRTLESRTTAILDAVRQPSTPPSVPKVAPSLVEVPPVLLNGDDEATIDGQDATTHVMALKDFRKVLQSQSR